MIFLAVFSLVMKKKRDNSFAFHLKRILYEKNWSSNQLAERTSLDKGSISKYVNNKKLPSFIAFRDICRALEVDPKEFWKTIDNGKKQ